VQIIDGARLDQILEGAVLDGLDGILRGAVMRQDDDRDLCRSTLECVQQLERFAGLDAHIADHHVTGRAAHHRERSAHVGGHLAEVALLDQTLSQTVRDAHVVVCDQHPDVFNHL
jgi:hypothetical protein